MNAKTVLIVEDEPAIREMVSFALARAGFEVDEAVDGGEAQERIASRLPDMILLDWMLPGTSGIDLARRQFARRPCGFLREGRMGGHIRQPPARLSRPRGAAAR